MGCADHRLSSVCHTHRSWGYVLHGIQLKIEVLTVMCALFFKYSSFFLVSSRKSITFAGVNRRIEILGKRISDYSKKQKPYHGIGVYHRFGLIFMFS